MKRTTVVNSRNIISIGYSKEQHLLDVVFSSGSKYVYEHVPEKIHSDFLESKSKGRYFGMFIRGKYKGVKIR